MPTRTMQMPPARRPQALTHAATAIAAGMIGWFANGSEPAPVAAVPAPLQRPPADTASVAAPATPLVALASDGRVTLRVEQQPLDWVLDQIALQGGGNDLRQRPGLSAPRTAASVAPAPRPASVPSPVLAACSEAAALQVDATQVRQGIESGTEAERFQGLMVARSAGITVPEPLLKSLFEHGASERVQVAAFEAYLALRADDPQALRAALEAAQYAPALAIQRDARQRLAELLEVQRLAALPPLSDP